MRKVLAGLALVGLGLAVSPSAVPVYDGVGAPDEPYRYVGTSNAAVPASATAAVRNGRSASVQVKSIEVGPQVLLDLGPEAFLATGTSLTVTATPLKADGERVPQGTIDGNVYRITVSRGAVLQPQRAQGFLFLRAAVMTSPDPVIVHRDDGADTWTQAKTVRAGQDILSTPFRSMGDYAVVHLPGSQPLSQSNSIGTSRLLLLVGGILVLVVVTVLVLRRRPVTEED